MNVENVEKETLEVGNNGGLLAPVNYTCRISYLNTKCKNLVIPSLPVILLVNNPLFPLSFKNQIVLILSCPKY